MVDINASLKKYERHQRRHIAQKSRDLSEDNPLKEIPQQKHPLISGTFSGNALP